MRLTSIPLISILHDHIVDYPTPKNLNYMWGFGSLAGLNLLIQIISGICLSMHYTANIELAFWSIEHILRDVNSGWLIRYAHANGASFFFFVVYIHIGKGLYFQSYKSPREVLWISGVIIFLLMMATAFMGYVLPWGQMSFWGATVITNLFSALPILGPSLARWIWGGFSVDNATLVRFFSLHYLLPFILIGLVLVHLSLLHLNGSTNPLGVDTTSDRIAFYPYFYLKDVFGFLIFLIAFSLILCYYPNLLGHPDNYIRASALITPTHIVPEWYFLPFYAVLRSVPDKGLGVWNMVCAVIALLKLTLNATYILPTSPRFNPIFVFNFWVFICAFLGLGFVGGKPMEEGYIELTQIVCWIYFSYFTAVHWANEWERKLLFSLS